MNCCAFAPCAGQFARRMQRMLPRFLRRHARRRGGGASRLQDWGGSIQSANSKNLTILLVTSAPDIRPNPLRSWPPPLFQTKSRTADGCEAAFCFPEASSWAPPPAISIGSTNPGGHRSFGRPAIAASSGPKCPDNFSDSLQASPSPPIPR